MATKTGTTPRGSNGSDVGRWFAIAATPTACALAVLLAVAAGPRVADGSRPEAGLAEAIARVHRFDGAAGDSAGHLEIVATHSGGCGTIWAMVRSSADGRHAMLEQRPGADRWWIHAECGDDELVAAPHLSDPRARAGWRVRWGVRPIPVPVGDVHALRNELQRWRQDASG